MVNMQNIINTLRKKTIHGIASERFGHLSGRIVELLQKVLYFIMK